MPVKPVFEIDFEDKKCECCGKYKTSLNYLKTKSFMFPSGYSNICTECLGRRLEVDDSWEVMDKICQYLDMPFKIDLYEKLSKDNAPAALLQAYAMQMGSEEYEGIDWTSYQEAYKELEERGALVDVVPGLADEERRKTHDPQQARSFKINGVITTTKKP